MVKRSMPGDRRAKCADRAVAGGLTRDEGRKEQTMAVTTLSNSGKSSLCPTSSQGEAGAVKACHDANTTTAATATQP
jgi:hypothetical protein